MACAVGMSPADFWSSTPHELFCALDGAALANGSAEARAEDERDRFQDFSEAMALAGF